ncbi:MAG: hypothetical protein AAF581_13195 [Planctomycetota bacterium]
MHSVTSRPEDAQPTELTPGQPSAAIPGTSPAYTLSPERQHMLQPEIQPTPRRRHSRRRRRAHARLRRNAVRFAVALVLALVILVMWRGVAHSQDRSPTFGWKSPDARRDVAEPQKEVIDRFLRERGATAATAAAVGAGSKSLSITEWIQQLSANRGSRAQATGSSDRGAPASRPEPSRRAPDAEPRTTQTQPPQQPGQATPPAPKQLPLAPPGLRGEQRPQRQLATNHNPRQRTDDTSGILPLQKVRDEELTFRSSLDLSLALERQFRHLGEAPVTDLAVLRSALTHHLIDLSIQAGQTDNPRDNLEAVRAYMGSVLRVEAVQRERASLDLLLTGRVLAGHRASQIGWCLTALIFSERINSYLDLEPVVTGDLLALRYRSGAHRYILVPLYPDRLYTDRDFLALAHADDTGEHPIRVLTRREFWGMVFAEAGSALLEIDNEVAQAAHWIDRGLALYPEHAMGHVSRARVQMLRNEKEAAKESLDIAVRLAPTSVDARLQRADVLQGSEHIAVLIEDLRWLSRQGKHPRASFRLARLLVAKGQFLAANQELQYLSNTKLPVDLMQEFPALRGEVEAAPWIAVLTGEHPDARRFQAIEHLRRYPFPVVFEALIVTMDDANLRLSNYAWQILKEMTERTDLPKVPERWRLALALP